jgi:hypothetical protein
MESDRAMPSQRFVSQMPSPDLTFDLLGEPVEVVHMSHQRIDQRDKTRGQSFGLSIDCGRHITQKLRNPCATTIQNSASRPRFR